MPDLTDQLPLAVETPETIKARLLADANAGIDPNDPLYLDTVPGAIWNDLNGAVVLELDRVYDRMHTEVPAAALPATSTGLWLDAWALAFGLERLDETAAFGSVEFTAASGTVISTGTQVSTVQTSADADPVTFETTEGGIVGISGVLAVPVIATTPGAAGNVAANTVTVLASSVENPTTVTNPASITGGSDVETDEHLAGRIARKMAGAGAGGNIDWYITEALNEPGVGNVTVFPNTPSLGHVTLSITDVNNQPFAPGSPVVASLKNRLDPSGTEAQGAGQAPPGATVNVTTPLATAITIAAGLTLAAGYSLNGTGGTSPVGAKIATAVTRYVNTLPVGGDVIRDQVLAAIVGVFGVIKTTSLTLNAGTSDIPISSSQVASLVLPLTLT